MLQQWSACRVSATVLQLNEYYILSAGSSSDQVDQAAHSESGYGKLVHISEL